MPSNENRSNDDAVFTKSALLSFWRTQFDGFQNEVSARYISLFKTTIIFSESETVEDYAGKKLRTRNVTYIFGVVILKAHWIFLSFSMQIIIHSTIVQKAFY